MVQGNGADSEVGQLRTVLMHRPGPELQRLTPRHRERVLLRTLPWLSRARQEHDQLSQALRDEGVEVLYLIELLQDCLEYQAARDEAIGTAVAEAGLGDELRDQLRSHLDGLGPETLAQVLVAGVTPEELKAGHGVVFELLDRHDFVLDPLPNLAFTRDSSFWIGDQLGVASLASERRRREAGLASVLYRRHPRFAGTRWLYQPNLEHLDAGDLLMLSPGVLAIGVGERTTPAGAERLARNVFQAGLAHTILAVPMTQQGGNGHLDTICAVIDTDAVIMHPAIAYTLTTHVITPREDGMRISRRRPFLEAAAQAMGIERLRVLDPGTEPATADDQSDDGGNVLALSRGVAVSHERNTGTNARLEAEGIRVIRVPSSELGSMRGGPRCMACPVSRDPVAATARAASPAGNGDARPLYRETIVLAAAEEPTTALPAWQEAPVPAAASVPVSRHSADQGRDEELASASLGSGRPSWRDRQWRRAARRPTRRNTPNIRPTTQKTIATVTSRNSRCSTAETTMTATITAPISNRKRSITTRYGRRGRVTSTGVRRPKGISKSLDL
jgi:arginine deiminase